MALKTLPSPSMQHHMPACINRSSIRPFRASRRVSIVTSKATSESTGAQKAVAEPGSLVFVAGASGGVGQLVVAKLAERGYKVRAMTRNAQTPLSLQGNENVEVVQGDCRNGVASLKPFVADVDAVCCCTGTTAFPSSRWKGNNGPEQTDYEGVKNLVQACPKTLKRFVLVSSAGVERQSQFPYIILNAFGVLKYKRMGEMELEQSGIPYTILRPGRLTDGPYTSYDLNTLLQATSGTRQAIEVSKEEKLNGETSRLAVAEAAVQSLLLPNTVNEKYSLTSTEGDGPGTDTNLWETLLA